MSRRHPLYRSISAVLIACLAAWSVPVSAAPRSYLAPATTMQQQEIATVFLAPALRGTSAASTQDKGRSTLVSTLLAVALAVSLGFSSSGLTQIPSFTRHYERTPPPEQAQSTVTVQQPLPEYGVVFGDEAELSRLFQTAMQGLDASRRAEVNAVAMLYNVEIVQAAATDEQHLPAVRVAALQRLGQLLRNGQLSSDESKQVLQILLDSAAASQAAPVLRLVAARELAATSVISSQIQRIDGRRTGALFRESTQNRELRFYLGVVLRVVALSEFNRLATPAERQRVTAVKLIDAGASDGLPTPAEYAAAVTAQAALPTVFGRYAFYAPAVPSDLDSGTLLSELQGAPQVRRAAILRSLIEEFSTMARPQQQQALLVLAQARGDLTIMLDQVAPVRTEVDAFIRARIDSDDDVSAYIAWAYFNAREKTIAGKFQQFGQDDIAARPQLILWKLRTVLQQHQRDFMARALQHQPERERVVALHGRLLLEALIAGNQNVVTELKSGFSRYAQSLDPAYVAAVIQGLMQDVLSRYGREYNVGKDPTALAAVIPELYLLLPPSSVLPDQDLSAVEPMQGLSRVEALLSSPLPQRGVVNELIQRISGQAVTSASAELLRPPDIIAAVLNRAAQAAAQLTNVSIADLFHMLSEPTTSADDVLGAVQLLARQRSPETVQALVTSGLRHADVAVRIISAYYLSRFSPDMALLPAPVRIDPEGRNRLFFAMYEALRDILTASERDAHHTVLAQLLISALPHDTDQGIEPLLRELLQQAQQRRDLPVFSAALDALLARGLPGDSAETVLAWTLAEPAFDPRVDMRQRLLVTALRAYVQGMSLLTGLEPSVETVDSIAGVALARLRTTLMDKAVAGSHEAYGLAEYLNVFDAAARKNVPWLVRARHHGYDVLGWWSGTVLGLSAVGLGIVVGWRRYRRGAHRGGSGEKDQNSYDLKSKAADNAVQDNTTSELSEEPTTVVGHISDHNATVSNPTQNSFTYKMILSDSNPMITIVWPTASPASMAIGAAI